MNIFSDFHHHGLFQSLRYLFEDRLHHKLYRPIGLEWFNDGYWKIAEPYNNNLDTVKQFLQPRNVPVDNTPPLNNDLVGCVTLDQFKSMDIDVVIASVPAHIEAYSRLIREHKPNAKLIYHIGNIGWHESIPWGKVDNIMASVKAFPVPNGKNVIFYKQEFDLNIFRPSYTPPLSAIVSFVNCLPQPEKYFELEKELPEYNFSAHGISCPNGIINTTEEIARIMSEAKFGYHNKPYGDGFGHVIFNWLAVGKPVIVNLDGYKDKLAGELLVDGETCIDMTNRNAKEIAVIVREISSLEYFDMCDKVRRKFKEHVDFNLDAENVGRFLNDLA